MRNTLRTLLLGAALVLSAGAAAALDAPHGEVHAAIRMLDRRIAKAPDQAFLYLRRGELHRVDENWKASEADLRRALEGGVRVARRALARLYLDAQRLEDAEREARRFLGSVTTDADGWALLARILHARDRHDEAAPLWQRATRCPKGDRPDLWIDQVRARVRRGIPAETSSALEDLDAASLRLRRPVSLELEALTLERSLGKWDAAVTRVDRIAERAQRKTSWTLLKAEVLEQAGRHDDARRAFKGVLETIAISERGGRKAPANWKTRADAGLARIARLATTTAAAVSEEAR